MLKSSLEMGDSRLMDFRFLLKSYPINIQSIIDYALSYIKPGAISDMAIIRTTCFCGFIDFSGISAILV